MVQKQGPGRTSSSLGLGTGGLSLRAKMILFMVLLALAPMVVVGVLQFRKIDETQNERLYAQTNQDTKDLGAALTGEVERLRSLLTGLSGSQTRFDDIAPAGREQYLRSLVSTVAGVERLALVDSSGKVVAQAGGSLSGNPIKVGDQLTVAEAAKGGTYSDSIVGVNNELRYQAYAPILQQGRVAFVLFADAKLTSVETFSKSDDTTHGGTHLGEVVMLIDNQGKAIYVLPEKEKGRYDKADLRAEPLVAAAWRDKTDADWTKGPLGDAYSGARLVKTANLVAVHLLPRSTAVEAVAPLRQQLLTELAIQSMIVLLLALVLAFVLSNQVVKPVLQIASAMSKVRAGSLSTRIVTGQQDELGVLARDINSTLDSVVSMVQTRDERDALQRNITRLLDEVSTVAEGDLTIQAEVGADQTGAIADAFNYMIDELRSLVQSTQQTADQVSTSSVRVTSLTDRMAASSEDQIDQLNQVRQAMSEMTTLMDEVRRAVGQAVGAADASRQAVAAGQNAVTETVEAMGRLRGEAREVAKKINRLSESSREIGGISRVIGDIAEQTHLLALHASIQAGMAGEHGRGFAVISEEIRSLAERSARATERIDELTKAIQSDTNTAMVATERSTEEVTATSRLTDEAREALDLISQVSDQIVELSSTIETLVERQTWSAMSLSKTVTNVAEATSQSTNDVRSVAAGMQSLNELAQRLRESVSVFRVEADEDDRAVAA